MKKLLIFILIALCTFSGCSKVHKSNSHTVLFSMVCECYLSTDSSMDLWTSITTTLYYDGTVEYYEIYSNSGQTETQEWELSDDNYAKIRKMLDGSFQDYTEDWSICDGVGYKMSYYDTKGVLIHEFNGYIDDIEFLQQLHDLLYDKE